MTCADVMCDCFTLQIDIFLVHDIIIILPKKKQVSGAFNRLSPVNAVSHFHLGFTIIPTDNELINDTPNLLLQNHVHVQPYRCVTSFGDLSLAQSLISISALLHGPPYPHRETMS